MRDVAHIWVPQMLWYCELIEDDERLASAFNQDRNHLWTSVTEYDELIEQTLDDGDFEQTLVDLPVSPIAPSLRDALIAFVRILDSFDRSLGDRQPDLQSKDWKQVQEAAKAVLAAADDRTSV